MISVLEGLDIPDEEIVFTASRSGGPGGQNVNKVSTRVTLHFDVKNSAALRPDQRERICLRLATRISRGGILKVTSQRTRSQDRNRSDALGRFVTLLRDALRVEQPRIATKVPRSSIEVRLDKKKKRTGIKRLRAQKSWDES